MLYLYHSFTQILTVAERIRWVNSRLLSYIIVFFSFTVWHFILLHWIVPCNPHLINTVVGDSLLGSLVACASTETIGVLHVGLFDYSGAELSEPEGTIRTYYC